jgi:D-aminoacyl-tRNA deacylase
MRIVVQRVKHAEVSVEGDRVGSIGKGALVFFGVHKEDSPSMIPWLAQKLIQLRIFSDEQDKMNLSLMDIGGEILVVSQFTLYADCSQGRRPDFFAAASSNKAQSLYEQFLSELRSSRLRVEAGVFGANMQVSLLNDGPVTLILDAKE